VTDKAKKQARTSVVAPAVDRRVVAELVARAQADGVSISGEGGLLAQLTKIVLESSLQGEMDAHLGYDKHDPVGRDGGNSRNGTRAKTVLTEAGPVEITVPRDRDGSFEPQIVRKRQRRLGGIDGIVLSLTAKGLTTGEVSAHLAEVYGASVSKDTISTITDRVLEGMAEWQNRPLDRVYPVIFHRLYPREDPRGQRRQPAHLPRVGGDRERGAGHPRALGRRTRRR
jgi:transposase-like protein